MANSFGRDSELFIKTKSVNDITVVEDSYFTAPLKIAKPFYDNKNNMINIMVMSASAGIMEGDCYRYNIELGEKSRMGLHGQSYNKIHRMKQGSAFQENKFEIAKAAFLDFSPKPSIPFKDSCLHSSLQCNMREGAAFIYSDILACGREKSGESFAFREYNNRTSIYYEGELIFYENQLLIPESQMLAGIGFFEGYTHQATLGFFYDIIPGDLPERLFDILKDIEEIEFGISLIKRNGLFIRLLGLRSDFLEKCLDKVRVEIYKILD